MKNDKIKLSLVKSGLEKIEGKYTGVVATNGQLAIEDLSAKVAAGRPAIDSHDAQLAISAIGAAIRNFIDQGYNVSTDIGFFEQQITGSVPAMDSALADGVNSFEIGVRESNDLRQMMRKMEPAMQTSSLGVVMEKVEDVATHAVGEIIGTSDFVLTGKRLSARGTGEGLSILNGEGVKVASVTLVGVQDDAPGQRIKGRLASAVPAGNYRLCLTTRGANNPAGELETFTKNVKVK